MSFSNARKVNDAGVEPPSQGPMRGGSEMRGSLEPPWLPVYSPTPASRKVGRPKRRETTIAAIDRVARKLFTGMKTRRYYPAAEEIADAMGLHVNTITRVIREARDLDFKTYFRRVCSTR